MSLETLAITGRLAPSPTGAQHVGNARTYLLAWLSVRSRGGTIRLRIEDIDSPRVKPGAVDGIYRDLEWLGLDWDGAVEIQTHRRSLYEEAFRKLQASELVYPCTCSRSDVERAASAPHLEHEGPIYPGTCAHRSVADAVHLRDQPFAWRLRTGDRRFAWTDGFAGPLDRSLRELGGDFVIWKSSGTPAYQLAVVVDDAAQGITEVLRGDDLIPSTPRQLLLYELLKLPAPSFAHVPLVVGVDGRRLAKRHGDTRLSALRDAGVAAPALLGLLAWSCGFCAEPTPITALELLASFSLQKVPPKPFVLTPSHLRVLGYA